MACGPNYQHGARCHPRNTFRIAANPQMGQSRALLRRSVTCVLFGIANDFRIGCALAGHMHNLMGFLPIDPLSVVLVQDAQHGVLTLNGDWSFVYTPNASYVGMDMYNRVGGSLPYPTTTERRKS